MSDPQQSDEPVWTLAAYREHIGRVLQDMRELIVRLVDERDRLYAVRFRAAEMHINSVFEAHANSLRVAFQAQEKSVEAHFTAQEKAVAAAFSASDKAIIKSEEAQRAYNERSNEFRGQLDDQAKMLMPRAEASALIHATEDKLYATTISNDRERALLIDRLGALEKGSANLQGRLWAITAVAWFVALAVSVALKFIH
jgi:hypothetical protein